MKLERDTIVDCLIRDLSEVTYLVKQKLHSAETKESNGILHLEFSNFVKRISHHPNRGDLTSSVVNPNCTCMTVASLDEKNQILIQWGCEA